MLKKITTLKVRYNETDQMGVVYHGNYANYFDIGRTEWLRSLGIAYKDMEKDGVLLPVIKLNCNYKQSAFYDDILTISTSLKKIPGVKIEFEYEIINQNNELIATGETILAFVNKTTKRPMRCPDFVTQLIEKAM